MRKIYSEKNKILDNYIIIYYNKGRKKDITQNTTRKDAENMSAQQKEIKTKYNISNMNITAEDGLSTSLNDFIISYKTSTVNHTASIFLKLL